MPSFFGFTFDKKSSDRSNLRYDNYNRGSKRGAINYEELDDALSNSDRNNIKAYNSRSKK